jgi:hypothetical protein
LVVSTLQDMELGADDWPVWSVTVTEKVCEPSVRAERLDEPAEQEVVEPSRVQALVSVSVLVSVQVKA